MENIRLEDPGETPIEKTVILRIIDDELHVSSSEDLDIIMLAGMLFKALQATQLILNDMGDVEGRVLQ